MRLSKHISILTLLAALIIGLPTGASGATKQDELKQIELDIQKSKQKSSEFKTKSESLSAEVKALRAELIALSQSVQQREARVTRLENEIIELTREEKITKLALEERHGQSVDTLIALQRLALNPPEAIIALPQEPADMVRSAILLRAIVPQIQEQAETLRMEVSEYAQKREKLEQQKKRLGHASQDLEDDKRRLKSMIVEKKKLVTRYQKDSKSAAKRVTRLTRKAKDLRSLLAKIEADKKTQRKKAAAARKKSKAKTTSQPSKGDELEIVLGKPMSGKPIKKAKGNLAKPGSGRIVMKYGQKEKLGGKHKGISIKTRKGAQIVATYDGQIAFAGPFRGYKQLLIIDHGDGYHTLLTGMKQIDVTVGQWLLSGEPVGVMSSNASSDATLYFELRKNGSPINPLPWIRQQTAKARG